MKFLLISIFTIGTASASTVVVECVERNTAKMFTVTQISSDGLHGEFSEMSATEGYITHWSGVRKSNTKGLFSSTDGSGLKLYITKKISYQGSDGITFQSKLVKKTLKEPVQMSCFYH